MKAYFGRKIPDLKALRDETWRAKEEKYSGTIYTVTREVELSNSEFQQFAEDLLEDQPWICKRDGGMNPAGEIRCIRVRNAHSGERILVNSEGYDYPRYTAIEE
ncbi:MAG: hypothetical protein H6Q73_3194 [Firmicutes bacterium]|nr:hypothetical protein [Bacillota bacterium]